MEGKNGDGTRLCRMSSQLVSLKKRCVLISAASVSPEPSRRAGSRVRSWLGRGGSEIAESARDPGKGAHLLQDADAVLRHVDRVQRLVLEDRIKDLVLVIPAEGRLAQQHLVDEHAKRPPVDRTAVALLEDNLSRSNPSVLKAQILVGEQAHFWGHELGCAAEGRRGAPEPHILLAESVVGNLDVPVEREQDVVELEVAVVTK